LRSDESKKLIKTLNYFNNLKSVLTFDLKFKKSIKIRALFIFSAICAVLNAFAQEKKQNLTANDVRINLGVGAQIKVNLNINSKLLMFNLPLVPKFGLTPDTWQSEFVNTANTVHERG
jgi:hypothetical protein